jgi:hypothetical protein
MYPLAQLNRRMDQNPNAIMKSSLLRLHLHSRGAIYWSGPGPVTMAAIHNLRPHGEQWGLHHASERYRQTFVSEA